MDTLRDQVAEGCGDVAILRHHALDQLKGLAGEVPGRVVIGDAEPRALYPLVLGRLVEVGERQGPLDRLRQPADADRLSSAQTSAAGTNVATATSIMASNASPRGAHPGVSPGGLVVTPAKAGVQRT